MVEKLLTVSSKPSLYFRQCKERGSILENAKNEARVNPVDVDLFAT